VSNFCVLKKTTPYGKIFKILFRKFTWRHRLSRIDVVVYKCRKIYPTGNQWNRASFIQTKYKQNFGCRSNCRYCADCAQNLQGQPPTMCSQCSRLQPVRFTCGWVITERVNDVFCPVEYFHDSSEAMFRFRRITPEMWKPVKVVNHCYISSTKFTSNTFSGLTRLRLWQWTFRSTAAKDMQYTTFDQNRMPKFHDLQQSTLFTHFLFSKSCFHWVLLVRLANCFCRVRGLGARRGRRRPRMSQWTAWTLCIAMYTSPATLIDRRKVTANNSTILTVDVGIRYFRRQIFILSTQTNSS